ncbi:MAG: hypothetical protein V1776_05610 [Candidatus Diapherotrites archaeon]
MPADSTLTIVFIALAVLIVHAMFQSPLLTVNNVGLAAGGGTGTSNCPRFPGCYADTHTESTGGAGEKDKLAADALNGCKEKQKGAVRECEKQQMEQVDACDSVPGCKATISSIDSSSLANPCTVTWGLLKSFINSLK